jgi:two-component system chemotaxis response regulator CheB
MSGSRLVVVGASAGGVEALSRFVESLPSDLDAAVMVVLHLSATARSVLPQILSRSQTLGATYPKNGQKIQPGRIYVAPPDHHLLVNGDRMLLSRGPRVNCCRPAIDPLFRSAAVHYREKVIGVVLSGTLDDGTEGLRAIKEAGGIAVVQSLDDSLFTGMPSSAIDAVQVDHILPAAEMGLLVEQLLLTTPPPNTAPLQARVELSIEEMRSGPEATKELGDAAEFACPECGGTLWQMTEDRTFRFRCRVGHAYSARHLLDEQTIAFDRALWTALRALRERADLAKRLGRRFRASNHLRTAERYENQATQSAVEADELMRLMREADIGQEAIMDELEEAEEQLEAQEQRAGNGNGHESLAKEDSERRA